MKHDETVHSSSTAFFFFVIFSSFSPPYHDLLYENLILVFGYCIEKKFLRFNDTDCYPKHFIRKIVNPSKLNKENGWNQTPICQPQFRPVQYFEPETA